MMKKTQTKKTFKDLQSLKTFKERFDYLKLPGSVGIETFGFDRYINQAFYNSDEWRRVRRSVILRDEGCDLGCKDRPIYGRITIHHLNPITEDDILNRNPDILNPDYLVCVSSETHKAIHYGTYDLVKEEVERRPNDTCPWK